MEFFEDLNAQPIDIILTGNYQLDGCNIEIKLRPIDRVHHTIYNGIVDGDEMEGTMVSESTGDSGTWSAVRAD